MDHMDDMPEIEVGMCAINFTKIRVAGVEVTGPFGKDDTLIFRPPENSGRNEVRVVVKSLEVNHLQVDSVKPGQRCGVEIGGSLKNLPRKGDRITRLFREDEKTKVTGTFSYETDARSQPTTDCE